MPACSFFSLTLSFSGVSSLFVSVHSRACSFIASTSYPFTDFVCLFLLCHRSSSFLVKNERKKRQEIINNFVSCPCAPNAVHDSSTSDCKLNFPSKLDYRQYLLRTGSMWKDSEWNSSQQCLAIVCISKVLRFHWTSNGNTLIAGCDYNLAKCVYYLVISDYVGIDCDLFMRLLSVYWALLPLCTTSTARKLCVYALDSRLHTMRTCECSCTDYFFRIAWDFHVVQYLWEKEIDIKTDAFVSSTSHTAHTHIPVESDSIINNSNETLNKTQCAWSRRRMCRHESER